MKLSKLSLRDKKVFVKYLSLSHHELSVYAFENIYIWRGLFDIYWSIIQDNLCLFFKDQWGYFLYLPPLGESIKPEVVKEAFSIMDRFNANAHISRIENVEEKGLFLYQDLSYECIHKSDDYLYKRVDLIQLKGNRYKPKRASCNYFIKHNSFEYLPFSLKDRRDCLKLYNLWQEKRKAKIKDTVYQGMLSDIGESLKILLNDYQDLEILGRLVKINDEIRAFTVGFKLNPDTFCILYEITDLSIKGLAQFIFRKFCNELKDYRYINIMDDSGLKNLKKVKLSYRPVRLIPSYIVKRKYV